MDFSGRNGIFIVAAILYAVWHTSWEWWRLLMVSVQLSAENDSVTFWHTTVLQTLSNIFILLGALIFGQLVDTVGVKITAFVAVLATGVLYIAHGLVETYTGFLWIMPFFVAHQLPSVCETVVAMSTEEERRITSTMQLRIPLGIATILGPGLSVWITRFFTEPGDSQLVAGILLLSICLPMIIFFLPEPPPPVAPHQDPAVAASPSSPRGRYVEYFEVLKFEAVWKTLLIQFILDAPYQYYDYLRRQYLVWQYLHNAQGVGYLLVIVGAVTVLANTCLIEKVQRWCANRQRRLQITLGFLSIIYCIIGTFIDQFYVILVFMPLQMAGVSIVYADLLTQLTSGVAAVGKCHFSKVISLARFTQLFASTLSSLLATYLTSQFYVEGWSYAAAVASLLVIVILQVAGQFMRVSHSKLPSYYITY